MIRIQTGNTFPLVMETGNIPTRETLEYSRGEAKSMRRKTLGKYDWDLFLKFHGYS